MRTSGMTLAVAVAAALTLGACGGEAQDRGREAPGGERPGGARPPAGAPPAAGKPVATIDVRETDFELEPSRVRVDRPGTVRFRVENAGRAPHALEVEGPKGEVETEVLRPGQRTTLTADLSRPGTYVWYCPVGDHKDRGMEGRIVVAADGSRAGDREGRGGDEGSSAGGGGY